MDAGIAGDEFFDGGDGGENVAGATVPLVPDQVSMFLAGRHE
jgi:hypothetical protein